MQQILVMTFLKLLLSFASLFVIFLMPHPTSSQPNTFYKQCLDEYGRYTTNSTYQKNLNALLPNLTSDTQVTYGFYNLSYGEDSDRVYALGLCRGDVKPESCRSCLNNSTVLLPILCPDQKDSVGVYDDCMLRYSDSADIYRIQLFRHFSICFSNKTSALDWDKFSAVLRVLLERLRRTASAGGFRKYAAGSAEEDEGSRSVTIYAYVQCLPDVTGPECDNCLVAAVSKISNCSRGMIGGRIIRPVCNLRYENYRFYKGSIIAYAISIPPLQPPSSPRHNRSFVSPSNGTIFPRGRSNKSMMIMAIVVPSVAFIVVLIFVCIYLRMRKAGKAIASETKTDNEIQSIDSLQFDFETIKVSTNNFSEVRKLGQGGFGPVYKGSLSNGLEVAVKRLSNSSGQGEIEFQNEVLIMSKLQHRNLVRLLGFCFQREERLLIYEFLPNKSLDCFIFDPITRAHLDWEKRHQIIEGIARGLVYLHEDSQQRIIHRDLKASNILLDAELSPKISDFGMARLIDQTQANTNRIVGTYGYMAPEYAIHGKFSTKSDVFSFGVLILEIVSGQRNNSFQNGENVEHLLSFAWKNWRRGTSSKIVDNTLNYNSRYEIMRCIHIGLLCVQNSVAMRPTLASIVVMLSSNSISLPEPLKPAFFMNARLLDKQRSQNCPGATSSSEQENNSTQVSTYEASITKPYPR